MWPMNTQQQHDISFMEDALKLAEQARGRTSPNPMVGAVLVKDGQIIGKGYHTKAGCPHAEIEALRDASEDPRGATLYVTLEPCCMHGKTPPCTDAIIQAGIIRVVTGMIDPDPRVQGKGIAQLQRAGILVDAGLLEDRARRLNEAFITHTTTGRPFVISKFAMSLDGKIATRTGDSKYITNAASREYVHTLREQVDAILVGIGTVLADNPLLTSRIPRSSEHGEHVKRNPQRVILDTHLRIPLSASVVQAISEAHTTIFTGQQAEKGKIAELQARGVGIETVEQDERGTVNLEQVFNVLGNKNVQSVLLEGGADVNGNAYRQRLIDKVLAFIAPMIIGGKDARSPVEGPGIDALRDAIRLSDITIHRFGDDLLIEGYVKK